MGIFNRIKKTDASATAEDKEKKVVETQEAETTELSIQTPKTADKKVDVVLISPRVSEKAAVMSTKNTYVFNVPVTANKLEVRRAVEALYGVKVQDVNTVRGIGKVVRRGRVAGRRNRWKKALVTLKKGEKIDLFVGV